MSQVVRVAAVQTRPDLSAGAQNLQRIRELATESARRGADIVVFPECALRGIIFDSLDEAAGNAQGPEAADLAAIGELAKELDVAVVVGLLERADKGVANSALVALPDGNRSLYRKTHLTRLGADRWATAGESLSPVYEFRGLRFGVAICYELRFPEIARVLALRGVDALLVPTNSPLGYEGLYEHGARTRAWENRIWVVLVNRGGTERGATFIGRSMIADPYGKVVASVEGDEEAILIADLDPQAARAKLLPGHGDEMYDYFAARRPTLYADVCVSGDEHEAQRGVDAR
jgi:predicted amidohydrolase